MSEKGILFSGPMVRAILDGRKNQTRRICKCGFVAENPLAKGYFSDDTGKIVKPKYQSGDVLYVRETWASFFYDQEIKKQYYWYKADYPDFPEDRPDEWIMEDVSSACPKDTWHSSMFMPKAAARIWLKVTGVRVERLQEITDDGARQEGVENREAFKELWGKINGETSWNVNPFVWVIQFERVEK